MNNSVSPLQLYTTRDFTGLSESNHLSNAYLTEPEKVGSVLAYAFGQEYSKSILNLITGGIGNVKTIEINNHEYDWDLHTQGDRSVEVVGNLGDGGSTPGIGSSPFRVKLAEKLFSVTDNLIADDGTQVRIQEEPYQDGNAYVYTLQLASPDPAKFIDSTQIAAGARFSKDYSTVEAYSIKGGTSIYKTPFKLRNMLTTLRHNFEVARNAATDLMVVALPDPKNPSKTTKMWTRLVEWQNMADFYREIDRSLVYSIYNKRSTGEVVLKGQNKRPIYTGAGLREQISPANVRFYNTLTYNILMEFLMDLSYGASAFGGNHKFLALTGKMGMIEFDNAITEKAKALGFMVVNEGRFISGQGMDLKFGSQFKTVMFPNGIELTVAEFEPYDDINRHRTVDPKTLRPLESYRFTILNIGRNQNGTSNVRKVVKKDSEMVMWHAAGSISPTSGVAKSMGVERSSGIDGYECFMLSECGIMLEDPTSCGELIRTLD